MGPCYQYLCCFSETWFLIFVLFQWGLVFNICISSGTLLSISVLFQWNLICNIYVVSVGPGYQYLRCSVEQDYQYLKKKLVGPCYQHLCCFSGAWFLNMCVVSVEQVFNRPYLCCFSWTRLPIFVLFQCDPIFNISVVFVGTGLQYLCCSSGPD